MVHQKVSEAVVALAQWNMNRILKEGPARIIVIEPVPGAPLVPHLVKKGCSVRTLTLPVSIDELEEWAPDGFILSGRSTTTGAAPFDELLSYIKETRVPVFGIGGAHQALALSEGVVVEVQQGRVGEKLPVKNRLTGKMEIKELMHPVVLKIGPDDTSRIEVTHRNVNEPNAEGIQYKRFPGFSVQYKPTPSDYLLNHFIDLVKMRVFKNRSQQLDAFSFSQVRNRQRMTS